MEDLERHVTAGSVAIEMLNMIGAKAAEYDPMAAPVIDIIARLLGLEA
jgi:hypothetical protein